MLLVESAGPLRRLTLNRPERMNALTADLLDALRAALAEADADPAARAVLLTGTGRAFSAGQDLQALEDAPDLGNVLDRHYNPLIRQLRAMGKPVVCAVNGVAAGAGANIALACDIVLAASSARFIQSFTGIGLVPDCGGTWMLPRLVGLARAQALLLLAEPVPAAQAADWGMIWKAVPDEALMAEAEATATRLASLPPLSLALTKQALRDAGLDAALDRERDLQRMAGADAGHRDAVAAFLRSRRLASSSSSGT